MYTKKLIRSTLKVANHTYFILHTRCVRDVRDGCQIIKDSWTPESLKGSHSLREAESARAETSNRTYNDYCIDCEFCNMFQTGLNDSFNLFRNFLVSRNTLPHAHPLEQPWGRRQVYSWASSVLVISHASSVSNWVFYFPDISWS